MSSYKEAKKEMSGGAPISLCNGIVHLLLAKIKWTLNRNSHNSINNSEYNKQYFLEHKCEINEVLNMLSDEYSKEVYKKCILYRTTHKLKYLPEYNSKNQYFPEDIVKIKKDEVFIDCGAYIGDTIDSFVKHAHNGFGKIVCFEASKKNAVRLKKRHPEVIVVEKCVFDSEGFVAFCDRGSGDSKVVIDDSPVEFIDRMPCCTIDGEDVCSDATFIKMDIEGAEMRALKGAEKTIIRQRPILTICIYHSPEDMVQIPLWIQERCGNYSFFVRHHLFSCSETVLYAIPDDRLV